MNGTAVRAEALSKQYEIGAAATQNQLRELLVSAASRPFRRSGRESDATTVWALRDVSFDVPEGQAVGIIGRNGAGKSTLLKILSRITEPSSGRAVVRGRVGSLLEVGTGFHPELTGRENIYLNGAVLGLSRNEIRTRFDQIVEFAGIGPYLHTPVKRYSSGMYTRLAFSVAAHMEPDILVVDEVLAVGDAEFQKRSLGRMRDVAGEGRTVLFVSHNLVAVEGLCTRGLLLEQGRVAASGDVSAVLARYRSGGTGSRSTFDLTEAEGRPPGFQPVITRIRLEDMEGHPVSSVPVGAGLRICLEYEHEGPIHSPVFAALVQSPAGQSLVHIRSEDTGGLTETLGPRGTTVCTIAPVQLLPGEYTLDVGCKSGLQDIDLVRNAAAFTVEAGDFYGTGSLPSQPNAVFLPYARWDVLP